MSLANMSLPDLIGTVLGLVLTLAVFSYLLPGDNALFRFSIHLFIGVAAGYAAAVVWYNVLWPQLIEPLLDGTESERYYVVIPLLLSGLLAFKVSPRLSRFGNPAAAYMVGVGLAAAIGGALMGTLLPQVAATINLFDTDLAGPAAGWFEVVFQGGVILLGVATTLIYFHYGTRGGVSLPARRSMWIEIPAWVGQWFIAIALGSIFAGVYLAALTAMIERLQFIINFGFALVQ